MLDLAVRTELEQAAGVAGASDAGLGRFTTLGCGGPAAFLIEAQSSKKLMDLLAAAAASGTEWFILGSGSNLLIADSGWDGLVIRLTGELKHCSAATGGRIECGAGASLLRAATVAADTALSGLEPLAGIPGSIGGAVALNAGAWGTDIGDLVDEIEICLPGEQKSLGVEDLKFSYRNLELPADAVVSRVMLALKPADPVAIRASMDEYRKRREASQPTGRRTCGSVFRNPASGGSAGELLDRAGCKGLRRGTAAVSESHANFIINEGGATSADIVGLMDECRRRVLEQAGVLLEPEVRLLGDIRLQPLA